MGMVATYKLKCQEKAGLADVFIHPEIGKVTTNPVEASKNVLVRYRSKNWNLARLHYHVSTNIGLIQGCMASFLQSVVLSTTIFLTSLSGCAFLLLRIFHPSWRS
uniref:Uncharacterized protein n=1 Tax=Amphimedon queenslandica TaxID=400682 RepID=A0A1X7TVI9_AMPQE